MTRFHAILLDETACEFGVTIDAANRAEAWDILEEDYPESRVTQVLTQEEIDEREIARYDRLWNEDPYGDDYGY